MLHTILICLVFAFPLTEQEPQKEGNRGADQKDREPNRTEPRRRGEPSRSPFDSWLFTRPDASSRLGLSHVREVQAELNLSAEQIQAIDELTKKTGEQQRALYAELQRKISDLNREADTAVKQVLDPKQTTRMDQLRLQRIGSDALNKQEIADQLGLSEEQRAKLAKLHEELQRTPTFSGFSFSRPGERGTGADSERTTTASPTSEARGRLFNEMLAVLTPEQKSKWQEMLGPKFEFPSPYPWFNGPGTWGTSGPSSNISLRVRSRQFELGRSTSNTRSNRITSMRLVQEMYGPIGPFRYKSVVEALGLTDDQSNQIKAIGQADADAIRQIADPSAADASEKISQINKDTREKLEKVLTEDQKRKLSELTSQ